MKLHLITPFWKPNQPRRAQELAYCKKVNAEIFDEVTMPNKVNRMTYLELFQLTKPDCINVIANSDIYFDESINLAKDMKPAQCYALTRWDNDKLWRKAHLSQDVWIFKGDVSQKLLNREINFEVGVPGCDNRIAHEIHLAGYHVMNPSLSIKCHHKHESKYRTYSRVKDRIDPPYRLVYPIEL